MHLSVRICLAAYIELCRILRVPTRPFTPDDTIVGRDSYGSGLHGSEGSSANLPANGEESGPPPEPRSHGLRFAWVGSSIQSR